MGWVPRLGGGGPFGCSGCPLGFLGFWGLPCPLGGVMPVEGAAPGGRGRSSCSLRAPLCVVPPHGPKGVVRGLAWSPFASRVLRGSLWCPSVPALHVLLFCSRLPRALAPLSSWFPVSAHLRVSAPTLHSPPGHLDLVASPCSASLDPAPSTLNRPPSASTSPLTCSGFTLHTRGLKGTPFGHTRHTPCGHSSYLRSP